VLGSAQYAAAAPLQDGDLIASTNLGKLEVFRPDGTLVQTIETGAPSFQAGICWNQTMSDLRVTNSNDGSMTLLDSAVSSITYPWVSPLTTPVDCDIGSSGNVYVLTQDLGADVVLLSPAGVQLDSFDLANSPLTSFPFAAPENAIELASDDCTLFYVGFSSNIKRYDVCTDTQLADFATVPPPTNTFLNEFCVDLEIRANGEVITSCSDTIHRMNSDGTLAQSYPNSALVPPIVTAPTDVRFADPLLLDPDGTSFWTAQPLGGQVWRVDIASGNTLINFGIPNNPIGLLPGNVGDLEIFASSVPPEECPPGTTGVFPDCTPVAVGGEMIPLDTTMILLAGSQMTAAWILPVIVAGLGFAIVIARKFRN